MEVHEQLKLIARYDDNELSHDELRDLVKMICMKPRLLKSFLIYFAMKTKEN